MTESEQVRKEIREYLQDPDATGILFRRFGLHVSIEYKPLGLFATGGTIDEALELFKADFDVTSRSLQKTHDQKLTQDGLDLKRAFQAATEKQRVALTP